MISGIYLAALFTCTVSLVSTVPASKNEDACKKFGVKPNFDVKMLLGPQWRIYYTWNVKHKSNCLAIKFYTINAWIVSRFYRDMGEYLVEQPLWSAAMVYMTIGAAKDQMLLLADHGPAGRFHGVPNLIRNKNFLKFKKKNMLTLLKFQMKVLPGGQYLVVMNCGEGSVTLCRRESNEPPHRGEIESVAKKLGFGRGALACNVFKQVKNNTDPIFFGNDNPPSYDMK